MQLCRICALVGLVPPDPKLGDQVRKQVTLVDDNIPIHWRPSHGLANDTDREDGAETLLLTAMTEATAESVIEAVQVVVKELNEEATCELWASAPAPLPLRPLEGYEPHILVSLEENNNKAAVLALQKWGLVVQRQVLTSEALTKFQSVAEAAIANIDRALKEHQPQLVVGQDAFCFREIASRNKQRFDLRLEGEVLALVQELVLSNDNIRQFLQQALGLSSSEDSAPLEEATDFDLSVVYSRPGACAQGWHADGNHTPGASDAGWEQEGWNTQLAQPYALCLFVPLIDLNEQVGYTQFWPGSHQHRGLVGFGPVAQVTQSVWNASCQAGDGILYDYRLLHQGMPNTSRDVTRPVLQIIFKRKWYVEKANYGVESLYSKAVEEKKP